MIISAEPSWSHNGLIITAFYILRVGDSKGFNVHNHV